AVAPAEHQRTRGALDARAVEKGRKKTLTRAPRRFSDRIALQVLGLFQAGIFATVDRLRRFTIDNGDQLHRDLVVGARQYHGAGVGEAERRIAGADLADRIDCAFAAHAFDLEPGVPVGFSIARVADKGVTAFIAEVGYQRDLVKRPGGAGTQQNRRRDQRARDNATNSFRRFDHPPPIFLTTYSCTGSNPVYKVC